MKASAAAIVLANPANDLLELTKPRITLMVVLTTAVGLFAASSPRALAGELMLVCMTLLGTCLLAASASALNMWLERGFDRRMRRTEARPLPAGRLQADRAFSFGLVLGLFGVLVLTFLVNLLTAMLGLLTLLLYLLVYTPLKRKTEWSTLIGAVPGAIPPMMGWTAVHATVDPQAWGLFALLFFWQMPHFFAIAWLCREDYRRAGFAMISCYDPTGVRTAAQSLVYTILLVPASLAPWWWGTGGSLYLWAALALGIVFLWFSIGFLRERSDQRARQVMLYSVAYLPLCLLALVMSRLSELGNLSKPPGF